MTRADLVAIASGGVAAGALLSVPIAPGPATILPTILAGLVIAVMIGWVAWQDVREFTIPDGPLLAIAMLGLAQRLSGSGDPAHEAVFIAIDAVLCGGALLAIREAYYRLKGYDGLGLGDVKLAAAGGSLVGTIAFAHALLTASALGIVVVLVMSRLRPERTIDRLPFGALLAPACGLVWALSAIGAGR